MANSYAAAVLAERSGSISAGRALQEGPGTRRAVSLSAMCHRPEAPPRILTFASGRPGEQAALRA